MNVFAYCAASFYDSVRQAAGVEPLCSPPLNAALFDATLLQADLVYIKLHGLQHQPFWYGDDFIPALSREQILHVDLSHTTLFVANCHSFNIQDGQAVPGPMLSAALQAGARAVVCGTGETHARASVVDGCDLLGRHFRILHNLQVRPGLAFRLARGRLALSSRQDLAITDSLAFRIFTRSTS
jgi:hypothetical protein